jgi:integrase
MKTETILNAYLEYAERSIVSVLRTRSAVKNLTKHLGRYDHTRLTPSLLRGYRRGEQLAPASINRDLGVLRAALKLAKEEGRVQSIPEIPERSGAASRQVWLRPEEITRLLEAAKPYPVTHRFILLALLTGQRREAILSLRWQQVDRTQGVIWFSDHDLGHAERRKGRGAVPISAELAEVLDALANGSEYVLLSERGTRLQDVNRDHWTSIVTEAGLEGLTPHDLRHTVATTLIREQVPLIDVSKLLGHRNTLITERIYVQHQPQFLQSAVSRLGKLVKVA